MEPREDDREVNSSRAQETPPHFIWILGFLVSALTAGAFFLTGLFFSTFMGWKATVGGGIFTGFIPGLVSGAVMAGLVYAVHPKWTGKAIGVSLFLIAIPLVAIPAAFNLSGPFSVALAPIGTVLGGLIAPKTVRNFRRRELGRVKSPKGSWEDNF